MNGPRNLGPILKGDESVNEPPKHLLFNLLPEN